MASPATETDGSAPRTARGRRTLRLILDAAEAEFGSRGFHATSISGITARAGVALGTFYTYFSSKEALFRALVRDMGTRVREHVGPTILAAPDRLTGERAGLAAYIAFVREHPGLYRVIEEAQFVAPDVYRAHYDMFVEGYVASFTQAAARGEIREGPEELRAWAIVGMNVLLGLRYGVWASDLSPEAVAEAAGDLVSRGLAPGRGPA